MAQWGSLARTWAPKGKQPKIKTTGIRKALKMFGGIDFFSGAFHYMESEGRFNGDTYITFLKHLLKKFHLLLSLSKMALLITEVRWLKNLKKP